MLKDLDNEKAQYEEQGYFVIRDYFTPKEMSALRQIIVKFYSRWKKNNATFYQEEAFNASLITGSEYLADQERLALFTFISAEKMMRLIDSVITKKPAFMNTQLFFNPVNPQQKDFWHRDCQYDFDVSEQMDIIKNTQVLHLRVPLFDERGMELIPGTHKRWDNEEEYNVRQEEKGKLSSDTLSGGKTIKLAAGDILLFSADMIHRGLYGLDRLALDILVFEYAPNYIDYIDEDCLPNDTMMKKLAHPTLFENTYELINSA